MSRMTYGWILLAPWLMWMAYWGIRAYGAKAVVRVESWSSRLSYLVPAILGGILLVRRPVADSMHGYLLPREYLLYTFWAGAALMYVGLGFTVWAREYLGGNWSASVTLKQDHELVRSGPYAWTRHPIYTGLFIAVIGCAVVQAQWRGLIGLAFVTGSLVRKLKIEERFLTEQFGEAYLAYKNEVAALIPGLF